MRKLTLLFTALVIGTTGIMASTTEDKVAIIRNAYTNNSFIFVENGVTFSVYPDGEFDFYIENQVSGRRDGVTLNSGYDYSPYTQYDDYGAVIQVENVAVYYDYYGRVNQIGDIDINYRSGRVNRLGSLNVYYNNRGIYNYHTGFINRYNRNYVYSPFHRLFARPSIGFSLVLSRPYRRYYTPIRYSFYNPYRNNSRRVYAKIGREHRYNSVRRQRSTIYRNDSRVAVRNNNTRRSNRNVGTRNNNTQRNNRAVASNNRTRTNTNRSNNTNRSTTNRNVGTRNNNVQRNNRTVASNSRTRTNTNRSNNANRSTTARRTNTTTQRRNNSNANRSTTNRNTNARSTQNRTQRTVAQTRTQRSSNNNRSANKSRSTSSRSVSKSPSRSTRNSKSTSTSSRSRRSL